MTMLHYTCSHSRDGIDSDGIIKPNPQPMLGGLPLAWFTDLKEPPPDALGMARQGIIIKCDRFTHCYEVATDAVSPWVHLRRRLVQQNPELKPVIDRLEEFAMPMHWFISDRPIAVMRRLS